MGKHHSENSREIPSLGKKIPCVVSLNISMPCFILVCSVVRKKQDVSRSHRALRLNSPPSSEEGREHGHSTYVPFCTKILRHLRFLRHEDSYKRSSTSVCRCT